MDEAGDFNSHAVDAFSYMVQSQGAFTVNREVGHIEVPCRHCGAVAGQVCRRIASFDEAAFGGHHITRDHDAKLASVAARAMGVR